METLIKTYSLFEPLLKEKIASLASGTEEPLFKLLGRDSRRFHGYLKSHELQLIANIASGAFAELKLGKLDVYATSKEKFQHYVKP